MNVQFKVFYRLLPALFLFSCLNQQIFITDDQAPEHIDYVKDKIHSYLEERTEANLVLATTTLFMELNRDRISRLEAKQFINSILSNYKEEYIDNNSEELYRLNYNRILFQAQQSFDEEFPYDYFPTIAENIRLFNLAEENRLAGNPVAALHYLSRSISIDSKQFLTITNSEVFLWYIEHAYTYNYVKLLSYLFDYAASRVNLASSLTEELTIKYQNSISQGWQAPKAIDASVTVIVDLGIRVENNIGFPERSLGTGFYVSKEGHIITNYHVIASEVDPKYEGKTELFIRPSDNSSLRIPARVIGYDRILDIALIKAEISSQSYLGFDYTPLLDIGSLLYVVGSPGGLQNTVTSGIVSALGRRFLQIGEAIQIDVPVNPGNSGGPMFDERGNLVGVVFAGIEQFEGINFAIPSTWIQYVFPRLFEEGEISYPWFGLALRELRGEGLEVVYVVPNSPAEKAGFQVDEVIIAVNEENVSSITTLQSKLLSGYLGELYNIRLRSDNRDIYRIVYTEERPFSPLQEIINGDRLAHVWLPPIFGMKVTLADSTRRLYSITEVFPGSIADESGLSEDDVFQLYNWYLNDELRVLVLQILIQKRTSGFLSEGLQLANYIDLNSFI